MDWSVLLIEFGLSLAITIFGYLLIPVIIVISGKKYEKRNSKE